MNIIQFNLNTSVTSPVIASEKYVEFLKSTIVSFPKIFLKSGLFDQLDSFPFIVVCQGGPAENVV